MIRVENIVGKGENAGYQHFLLFPQCFQKASFQEASKGVIVWEWVNPFPNKPRFLCVRRSVLLNTLWEKEKFLVMSYFSFSRSVFYSFGVLSDIFIKFDIVICKLFQFGKVQNWSFGKDLRDSGKRPFENIVGNGEIADGQHFLLVAQSFLPLL